VIATTTRRLAPPSPWSTKANCCELSWQQSTFGKETN